TIGLLDRWVGNGARAYEETTAGLGDAETVREAQEIWTLAQRLRASGALDTRCVESWSEFLSSRIEGSDCGRVRADIQSFLARHRHRGASYKDVIFARWGDEPDMLFDLIKRYATEEVRSPNDANRLRTRGRYEAQSQVLAAVQGPWAPLRRVVLRK